MKSKLSKKDIFWTYFSKAFTLLSGIITLPLILRWLSEEEIAVNYLFLNIISYTVIFDLGFSPQFSRNIGFVFGGAPDIKSVGYETAAKGEVNYKLVKNVISTAKYLYGWISLVLLVVLSTAGTFYVSKVTSGYSMGSEILWMWLAFTVLETFDFYYKFYTPLLQGKGSIAELGMIDLISSVIKVILTVLFLWLGWKLWAVLIGVFSKIVITRIMSVYSLYYSDGLKDKLRPFKVSVAEKKDMIHRVWHNAKRSAIVQVASFCTTQVGFLFTGWYLSASDISSYGLLMQLTMIITGVSMSLSNSISPIYAQLRANNDMEGIKKNFYFTTGVYYIIFIAGSIFLLTICPILIDLVKSNALLPPFLISVVYLIYKFLEGQHCVCIYCISSKNYIYDTESASIMAVATIILLYLALDVLHMGLFGVVFVQFLVAVVYANWKWPYECCKDLGITYPQMIYNSIREVLYRIKIILARS